MNCFREPLFNCVVLMLTPELLHLIGCSLWNQSLILNFLPERCLVKILSVVCAHDLKEFDSFNDCELFLFSNIQLFTCYVDTFRQEIVVFLGHHLGASNFHGVSLIAIDGISDPVANVN